MRCVTIALRMAEMYSRKYKNEPIEFMRRVCVYCIASDSPTQREDVTQIRVYVKYYNPFHMSQGTQYASIRIIFCKFSVGKYFLFIVRISLDVRNNCVRKVLLYICIIKPSGINSSFCLY